MIQVVFFRLPAVFLLLFGSQPAHAEGGDELRLYMRGEFLFQKNCAVCHGRSGKGDGPLAKDVPVLPRNFRDVVFKFRSTPPGFQPTDADLKRTIRRGIAGSTMPVFDSLTDGEIEALIAYIKAFSKRWNDPERIVQSITIPGIPPWFAQPVAADPHISAGKKVFTAHCAICHGDDARGAGPAAGGLLDLAGRPILPGDLTQPALRSGPEPSDIFRTLATGMDGTPMPAYLEALGAETIWDLTAYILSLAPLEDDE